MAEPFRHNRCLVINDGSLSALVAAAAERDRGSEVIAWIPPIPSGLSEPGFSPGEVQTMVRHQASVVGYEQTIAWQSTRQPGQGEATGIETTILLLEAARCAAAHACPRVVWPLALGDDLRGMSWADERAELVNRLLSG